MTPTYENGQLIMCWKLKYWYASPKRFDRIRVRLAGSRVILLKRIIALPGETIAFKNGVVHIDGKPLEEPYINSRGNWKLPQRKVKPGYVYHVGDNRAVNIHKHQFGQTSKKRLIGIPLW